MGTAIKKLYKGLLNNAEKLPQSLELIKTYVAELYAIMRKTQIYKDIIWTNAQQKEFDEFWLENYGRKISNRWHKLYQAINGVFCVDYIPEMLYTTKIEPRLVDRNYAVALEDKSVLEALSRDTGCVVPETLIVRSAGQFYDSQRSVITQEQAFNQLGKEEKFILKRTVGSNSGKGILFIEQGNIPQLKEEVLSMGNDFIVQKQIIPHPVFAALNATSINTIRLITYIANDEVHHSPIALRIGRSNSNVDNIHAGGLVIGVRDDGVLFPNAYELGYGDKGIKYPKHPDNGTVFYNMSLPGIPQIIEAGQKLHGRFPHIGIISWDFTVDEKGEAVLVEANLVGQSVWFPQIVHGKGIFGEQTESVLKMIGKASKNDGTN